MYSASGAVRSAVADQQIGVDAVTRRRRLVGKRLASTAALDHVDSCASWHWACMYMTRSGTLSNPAQCEEAATSLARNSSCRWPPPYSPPPRRDQHPQKAGYGHDKHRTVLSFAANLLTSVTHSANQECALIEVCVGCIGTVGSTTVNNVIMRRNKACDKIFILCTVGLLESGQLSGHYVKLMFKTELSIFAV